MSCISRFFIVILSLCVISCTSAYAKDPAILNEIQQYYNSITSLAATFEQTLLHRESGTSEHRKGELFFKKKLNIRWDITSPTKEQWVITEQDIWDFLPDEEIAYRYSSDNIKNSGGIIGLLTGQTSLEKEYDVRVSGEDGGLLKLNLFPKEPSMQLVEATIWAEQGGAIRKIRSVDFYGNTNEINLAQLKKNPELKSSLFIFKVPKGIEVEDLRNSDLQKGIFQ